MRAWGRRQNAAVRYRLLQPLLETGKLQISSSPDGDLEACSTVRDLAVCTTDGCENRLNLFCLG